MRVCGYVCVHMYVTVFVRVCVLVCVFKVVTVHVSVHASLYICAGFCVCPRAFARGCACLSFFSFFPNLPFSQIRFSVMTEGIFFELDHGKIDRQAGRQTDRRT